ncbi:MAG: serine hydroxymethyltransferase [Aggregatilineales bacterium]|nr:serine hydroxymethyltransferase [Aggregatilineales bacterium]HPV07153.1 serine hydroxymethyltransferase [Aggregatilineales bacterium]
MADNPMFAQRFGSQSIAEEDPEVYEAMQREAARQHRKLELIASENYTSRAVLQATGSILTNKYAEGYPSRRYYGGCEHVDEIEELARERAKQLFGAEHANVQPHSGSQANMGAYNGLLNATDSVLAMDLAQGGHLTHGSRINFSGRLYHFISYGVDRETETIDYDQVASLARAVKPKMILAGYTAYPRTIDFARFKEIADEVGALFLVDMAHISGLVAGKVHPSPVPYADVVTSSTHKTLRGPRGGLILCKAEHARAIDRGVFPGIQGGPLMHVIAAKAICFGEALRPEFQQYAQQVVDNAKVLGEELQRQGLRLVTGGTDNHLLLVDLRPLNVTGDVAEVALDKAGITVNKNMIPYDPQPAKVTSGIRVGTPALTSRGFGKDEMIQVGKLIGRVLHAPDDEAVLDAVRAEVEELVEGFPVPGMASEFEPLPG